MLFCRLRQNPKLDTAPSDKMQIEGKNSGDRVTVSTKAMR